jgi:thiol-disulfide isomerase/thioredoxin
MKKILSVLLLFLAMNAQSLMDVYNEVNTNLQKNASSMEAVQKSAKDGLAKFEKYILANQKSITDQDLMQWIELYRGLEKYIFGETKTSDTFIDKNIASKKFAKNIREKLIPVLAELRKYDIGRDFPELPENTYDVDGKKIKISDFKDKILFVDFWATWCRPCMMELPNVKAAYAKYKSKGFEILGISFDKSEKPFREKVEEEKMNWYHISDYMGWSSRYAKFYGIRSIPATFLLKNGKIVAKNLRGKELEEKLKELLK